MPRLAQAGASLPASIKSEVPNTNCNVSVAGRSRAPEVKQHAALRQKKLPPKRELVFDRSPRSAPAASVVSAILPGWQQRVELASS